MLRQNILLYSFIYHVPLDKTVLPDTAQAHHAWMLASGVEST